jgi:hypothetical protein
MVPPVITESTFTVAENAANGTQIGSLSIANKEGNLDYVYKITNGNTANAFTIDTLTGIITVNDYKVINFESTPTYNLEVSVTIIGHPRLFDIGNVTVNVTKVNMVPVITSASYTIPEHLANGEIVGTLSVSNIDPRFSYKLRIVEGNAKGGFSIDSLSGKITVRNFFMLDYETTPSFTLKIKSFLVDRPDEFQEATATINLTDVVPVTDGLLSFYKFNGNGTDQTGYSNASISGGSYIIDNSFPNEQILSLSGYGLADLKEGFNYNQRSVSIWFKATSITSSMTIIFNNDDPSNLYGLSSLGVKEISGADYLEFNYSGVSFYAPISVNEWYHAVEVFDNKVCTYYLNDNLVYSSTAVSYLNSGEGYPNSVIGANRYFDRSFTGYIRYAKIYTKALTAEEVHSLFAE